jgi:hypothetical protein
MDLSSPAWLMHRLLTLSVSLANNPAMSGSNNHRYRSMVRHYKKEYQMYTRLQKTQLAERLVKEWQDQSPPGRFLEKDDKVGLWYCISDKSARRKTSQLLREGAAKIRVQLKNESTLRKLQSSPPPQVMMQEHPEDLSLAVTPRTTIETPERTPHAALAPAMIPTTPIESSSRALLAGHVSSDQTSSPSWTFFPQSHSYNVLRSPVPSQHSHHHYQSNPMTPSPSQQYMTPQRWQPFSYQASSSCPVPVSTTPMPTPEPTTTVLTPRPTEPSSLPLKPITPAHVNQKNKSTNTRHLSKLLKPAAVSRSNSNSSTNSNGKSQAKPKAPSPESVLDFDSLGALPTPSWDCSDILGENGDLSSLVMDLSSSTPAGGGGGPPKAIWERTPLEPLQENEEMCPELPLRDVHVSPLRFREESDSSQPFLLDAPPSFSFGSWEDSNGERSSFDMVEKVLRSESDVDHTRVCDILNELDKDLENEFMMPCHSF